QRVSACGSCSTIAKSRSRACAALSRMPARRPASAAAAFTACRLRSCAGPVTSASGASGSGKRRRTPSSASCGSSTQAQSIGVSRAQAARLPGRGGVRAAGCAGRRALRQKAGARAVFPSPSHGGRARLEPAQGCRRRMEARRRRGGARRGGGRGGGGGGGAGGGGGGGRGGRPPPPPPPRGGGGGGGCGGEGDFPLPPPGGGGGGGGGGGARRRRGERRRGRPAP